MLLLNEGYLGILLDHLFWCKATIRNIGRSCWTFGGKRHCNVAFSSKLLIVGITGGDTATVKIRLAGEAIVVGYVLVDCVEIHRDSAFFLLFTLLLLSSATANVAVIDGCDLVELLVDLWHTILLLIQLMSGINTCMTILENCNLFAVRNMLGTDFIHLITSGSAGQTVPHPNDLHPVILLLSGFISAAASVII